MNVNLISKTENIIDVIYTACRTCYSSDTPINIFNNKEKTKEDKLKLIHKVMKSGHLSTVEHVSFTFAIEGVRRTCTHQFVRHRLCSFSQQSQRYVEFKEDLNELEYLFIHGKSRELVDILNKYFVGVNSENMNGFYYALTEYLYLIKNGIKPEDARNILPNATKTNIIATMNLRELIHICNLRLCKHAQLEIRTMVEKMRDCVLEENDWLKPYLVPNCKNCTDFRDCKEIK